jgi:phosphate transport system substrate-binding protein
MKGSDTLVRLGQRWAEEYMKAHPGQVLQVSGGGSGTGIAALLNGSTDICQSSRPMKSDEYKKAEARGVKPFEVAVALDGIAIFVHKDNPVKEVSLARLKQIYTGKLTNWADLGGANQRIILYSRENNSGTYAFFKEHVMDGRDFAPETQNLPGTASVVNAISKDPWGIGYGGIAWETNVRHVPVKKNDSTAAVEPSNASITDGSYPIARDLFWYFNGQPTGPLKDLLNWVLSPGGQKIAVEAEYVPLQPERAAKLQLP